MGLAAIIVSLGDSDCSTSPGTADLRTLVSRTSRTPELRGTQVGERAKVRAWRRRRLATRGRAHAGAGADGRRGVGADRASSPVLFQRVRNGRCQAAVGSLRGVVTDVGTHQEEPDVLGPPGRSALAVGGDQPGHVSLWAAPTGQPARVDG